MEYITDLIFNYVMASAFIGWFTAQIIKVVIGLLDKDKRSSLKVLFSTGGMPSSHSANNADPRPSCIPQEMQRAQTAAE